MRGRIAAEQAQEDTTTGVRMDPMKGPGAARRRRFPRRCRARRAGRGAVLALLALVALGAAGALALMDSGGEPDDDAGTQAREVEAQDGGAAIPVIEGQQGRGALSEDLGPTSSEGIDVRQVGDYARMERSFDGTGTIAGSVTIEGGGEVPPWTLHIEPSRVTTDSGKAAERTIEAASGALTFEERDLPMAAYRVYATAEGHRSRAAEVMLFAIADDPQGRALDYVTVELRLRRVATVSGRVLNADGGVADDLEVFLVPKGGDTRVATERMRTDANGRFTFEDIAAGPWRLNVGHPTKPFVPSVPVDVDLAPVTLDDVELPVLASIELLIVDEAARPFPNVTVVGYPRGAGAGRIGGKTDGDGRFRARYMTPGTWRIEAHSDPAEGEHRGRFDYEITETVEVQHLEMVLVEPD